MNTIHLGLPLVVGNFKLKNRLCFSGHTTNLSDDPNLSERHLAYLEERTMGGIGLLVSDPLPIHPTSDIFRTTLRVSATTQDSFKPLITSCRGQDVPAILQLFHVGAHGCAKTAFAPAWSPSGMPSLRDQDGSHEMSAEEIETLIESFVAHARLAQKAGFDGVEIIGGGNMLLEQFWSSLSNRRQDAWGGGFAERMAFSGEVVQRIRQELGPRFLLGLVMTSNSGYANSLESEELEKILAWHEALGCIDYFSFCLSDNRPGERKQAIADLKRYKALLDNSCLQVAGNVTTPETAEELLQSGAADLVGMVRGLIADPALMRKYQRGDRRAIRPCVRCNQGCIGRRARDYTVACLVNPSAGRELQFPTSLPKTTKPLRLAVAGGGPAGLEAARSGAEAGHIVTLYERDDHLGGQWRLAGQLPGLQAYQRLIDWYQDQFATLEVETRVGTTFTAEILAEGDIDHLVIATGAGPTRTGFQRLLPNRPRLTGIDADDIFPVETVLQGKTALTKRSGAKVLLLDDIGFRQGIGTAIFLAEKGHKVTFLTRHPVPAPELQPLGGHDQLLTQLDILGIESLTESVLLGWSNGMAEYAGSTDSAPVKQQYDYLVLATTNEANQELEHAVAGKGRAFSLAGDCQGARKALIAIYEGRKAIMRIYQGDEKC